MSATSSASTYRCTSPTLCTPTRASSSAASAGRSPSRALTIVRHSRGEASRGSSLPPAGRDRSGRAQGTEPAGQPTKNSHLWAEGVRKGSRAARIACPHTSLAPIHSPQWSPRARLTRCLRLAAAVPRRNQTQRPGGEEPHTSLVVSPHPAPGATAPSGARPSTPAWAPLPPPTLPSRLSARARHGARLECPPPAANLSPGCRKCKIPREPPAPLLAPRRRAPFKPSRARGHAAPPAAAPLKTLGQKFSS